MSNEEFKYNPEPQKEIERENKQLVIFLRKLADSIENKQLQADQLLRISEFFMNYLFQEEVRKSSEEFKEPEKKDFMDFLTLGWYAYTYLLKEPDPSNDLSPLFSE